jgi:hypothetical protein
MAVTIYDTSRHWSSTCSQFPYVTQVQIVNSKQLCAKFGCSRRRERLLATNGALVGVCYKNITSLATSVSQSPTIGTAEDLNLVLWKRRFNYGLYSVTAFLGQTRLENTCPWYIVRFYTFAHWKRISPYISQSFISNFSFWNLKIKVNETLVIRVPLYECEILSHERNIKIMTVYRKMSGKILVPMRWEMERKWTAQ